MIHLGLSGRDRAYVKQAVYYGYSRISYLCGRREYQSRVDPILGFSKFRESRYARRAENFDLFDLHPLCLSGILFWTNTTFSPLPTLSEGDKLVRRACV